MIDFTGRKVLITGGAGAIGLAAARRFLDLGAHVHLVDRNRAALDGALKALAAAGPLGGTCAELSDEAAVKRAVAEAGEIDVIFANAGIAGAVKTVDRMSAADWSEIIAANLLSMALTVSVGSGALIDRGKGGAIVTMGSSMAGWDTLAGGAGYLSTKHAVLGLTKAAALDLAPHGIRVNAVCPGVIETALGVPGLDETRAAAQRFASAIPSRRIGQPEDVAEVVAFLASDAARHMTGASLLIDGGQTLQSFANGPAGGVYPLAT
jgi:NAD(P)-dependent dehydrogenase (short-subunit alcohol dehydrogenase family)